MDRALRFGERVQQQRTAVNLTIQELSLRTHIPVKYVTAIEESFFAKLPPAKAYRLAYIRELATALKLDPDECTQHFIREAGLSNATVVHPHRSLRRFFPFSAMALFARNGIVAGLILLFVGYLGWQVNGVLQPPRLVLNTPYEGYVSKDSSTRIEGYTNSETRLTVNGQNIMVNGIGTFNTAIDLPAGVNTMVITAINKHGRKTTLVRHLIVKQSAPLPTAVRAPITESNKKG